MTSPHELVTRTGWTAGSGYRPSSSLIRRVMNEREAAARQPNQENRTFARTVLCWAGAWFTSGRRTPTIAKLAWAELLMWDGRFASLEDQVSGPIETPEEMGQPMDGLLDKLRAIPDYQALFQAAFPAEGVSRSSISKAIATFERSVVSGQAPFDRWVAGDESAISPSAKRGFALFTGRAGCSECHQ